MSLFGIYFTSVPKPFWSEYSGEPFLKCIDCEVPLVESNLYVVQKRFVAGEAVFEMAMCERCRDKMAAEYSEETRENISAWITEHMQKAFVDDLPDDGEDSKMIVVSQIEDEEQGEALISKCMDHCLVCEKPRAECHRYSLAGLCQDAQLVAQMTPISRTPLMICSDCEEGMSHLVSKKTRDAWDRFVDEHFDGPPGVESDIPGSYPVAF